ncbi:MAG TPA: hypothetical protein VKA76_04430, partial [Gammaproteobacteria bacterium]|nr:hypothetical protein [Gammaproteobacteria bacterium]
PSSTSVAAFHPDLDRIVSTNRADAQQNEFFIYLDPDVYNPFRWILEEADSAAPPGAEAKCMCPPCRKATLHFQLYGLWT